MSLTLKASSLGELDYETERIRIKLQNVIDNVDDELLNALLGSAHRMVTTAKSWVRVDTGSLKRSIRVERTGPTYHHHIQVNVRAGGYVVNPKTKRLVDYALYVEAKYPYLEPAWALAKAEASAAVDGAMRRLTQ